MIFWLLSHLQQPLFQEINSSRRGFCPLCAAGVSGWVTEPLCHSPGKENQTLRAISFHWSFVQISLRLLLRRDRLPESLESKTVLSQWEEPGSLVHISEHSPVGFLQNGVLVSGLSLLRLALSKWVWKNICLAWLYPHLGISKPEEGRPAGSVTGNDITAPPNKELPPSPEKKTKVGTEWWVIFSCYHFLELYLLLLLLEPWMKFPFSELLVVLPQFWTFLENILYSYFTIVT